MCLSPFSFQSLRMTLASSSIVPCLLWGGKVSYWAQSRLFLVECLQAPRDLLSSHSKALPDSACMWVMETRTQVLELAQ